MENAYFRNNSPSSQSIQFYLQKITSAVSVKFLKKKGDRLPVSLLDAVAVLGS